MPSPTPNKSKENDIWWSLFCIFVAPLLFLFIIDDLFGSGRKKRGETR